MTCPHCREPMEDRGVVQVKPETCPANAPRKDAPPEYRATLWSCPRCHVAITEEERG